MASELGVQTIQHTNGTDALTVGSDGVVNAPNGVTINSNPIGWQFIKSQSLSLSSTYTDIDDIFSADFKFYKIYLTLDISSYGPNHYLRFIKSDGTVDSSSNYYGAIYGFGTDALGGTDRGSATNGGSYLIISNSSSTSSMTTVEITAFDPYSTNNTNLNIHTMHHRIDNGNYAIPHHGGGILNTTDRHTGISLGMPNGSSSGTITVCGIG